MHNLYLLDNTVKKYEWGSSEWIPSLTGSPNPSGESWAELWMGSHPAAPSFAILEDGSLPLDALVAGNPSAMVGETTARTFGGIPFLFKLLAAERPLSIQAHPSLEQAREGWARENEARIPLDAPNRNYKDANHKPEILCALTPFKAMCGFREKAEIIRLLDVLDMTALSGARRALDDEDDSKALAAFLGALFALRTAERTVLGREVRIRAEELAARNDGDAGLWNLMLAFAASYPEDPAIVSPLYLNVMDLEPGEAIYLPAGILHAYVHGFGVELMATSDNVLRGGLTSKHVDISELTRTLRFAPYKPDILRPESGRDALSHYPTPCAEFSLSRGTASSGSIDLSPGQPYIVVVTEGSLEIFDGANERLPLRRGQSAFIGASARAARLQGTFTAFVASVGWPVVSLGR